MTDRNYEVIVRDGQKPIKHWTRGIELEESAWEQINNVAAMPFIFRHIAVMPDAHFGKGSTIGTVVATRGAVMCATVGVDLGCGVIAAQVKGVNSSHLPDSLHRLRGEIEKEIPIGVHPRVFQDDRIHKLDQHGIKWSYPSDLSSKYSRLINPKRKLNPMTLVIQQFGTLGGGNHFIELGLDQDDNLWVMVHTGSRGVGHDMSNFFIEQSKEEIRKYFVDLPDGNLAYLPEDTELFIDYMNVVDWSQKYAWANRQDIANTVADICHKRILRDEPIGLENVVNCHHNFVAREHHFGKNMLVTRKGATRARHGEMAVIPGSMGTESFVVSGLGNPESFYSCSHGAGRAMGRRQAKRTISLQDHSIATEGVECRMDADVLEESPAAYKDIRAVMEAQKDLVEIEYTLRPILNIKG